MIFQSKNDEKIATTPIAEGQETLQKMIPPKSTKPSVLKSGTFWFFFTFLGISCFKPETHSWPTRSHQKSNLAMVKHLDLTSLFWLTFVLDMCLRDKKIQQSIYWFPNILYVRIYMCIYIHMCISIHYIFMCIYIHIATNAKVSAFTVEYRHPSKNLTTLHLSFHEALTCQG